MEWRDWLLAIPARCEGCRDNYARRTPPEAPPCNECRVELYRENIEVADVFTVSRGQVITRGMDGVIVDIDNRAIEAAMEMRGVKEKWRCLLTVRQVFQHMREETDA